MLRTNGELWYHTIKIQRAYVPALLLSSQYNSVDIISEELQIITVSMTIISVSCDRSNFMSFRCCNWGFDAGWGLLWWR